METTVNGETTISLGSSERFNGVPLVLGVGYTSPVSQAFKLGVGMDYSLLEQSATMYPKNGGAPNTFTVKNRLNIFIKGKFTAEECAGALINRVI